MEKYEAPKIPSLGEINSNSEPLKKLPSRWKKSAAIITGIGILGVSALSGCYSPNGGRDNNCDEFHRIVGNFNSHVELDLMLRLHHGGSGSAAYVVHLTEQEALGIIRMQLEAAGLNFMHQPPSYTTQGSGWGAVIGLNLFDCERGVAISHISWEDSTQRFHETEHRFARSVAQGFAAQTDLAVGVFYNPGAFPGWEWDDYDWMPVRPPDDEVEATKAEMRPILEARLSAQVEEFIAYLRDKGIL